MKLSYKLIVLVWSMALFLSLAACGTNGEGFFSSTTDYTAPDLPYNDLSRTCQGAMKFKPEQCTRDTRGVLVPPPLRIGILQKPGSRSSAQTTRISGPSILHFIRTTTIPISCENHA